MLKIDDTFWESLSHENRHYRLKQITQIKSTKLDKKSSKFLYLKEMYSKTFGKFKIFWKNKNETIESSIEKSFDDTNGDVSDNDENMMLESILHWNESSYASTYESSEISDNRKQSSEMIVKVEQGIENIQLFRNSDLEDSIQMIN